MIRTCCTILFALILPVSALAQDAPYVPDVLELDGSETLEFPADDRLTLVGGTTIEFWVQPDWEEDPGYDPVVLSNAGPEGPSYLVAVLRDRDGLGVMSGEQSGLAPFDFTDGKMHHVAIIEDGESTAVLVDGEAVAVLDLTFKPLPSAGFWVGTSDGDNNPFPGAIAGLRLWDIAVQPATIRAYAQADISAGPEGEHPDVEWLIGESDFTNNDILLQDFTN